MGKAALEALARTLAHEERQHGIHVNVVAPGLVETDMGVRLARAFTGNRELADLRSLDAASPFGRVCQPADVAEVVLWLCTAAAGYVTGQRIEVDGGGTPADRAERPSWPRPASLPRRDFGQNDSARRRRCIDSDSPKRRRPEPDRRFATSGSQRHMPGRASQAAATAGSPTSSSSAARGLSRFHSRSRITSAGPRSAASPLACWRVTREPVAVAGDQPFAGDVRAVHVEAPRRQLDVLAYGESGQGDLEVLVDAVARQFLVDR